MHFRFRLGASLTIFSVSTALSLSAQTTIHSAPMIERYGKPYVMVTINGKGP